MIEPDAREIMVREHLPRLLRLCAVILGGHRDAEDIVQDVFLKAFVSLHRFRGDSAISTWLTRIAIHACRDRIRWKRRRKEVSEEEAQDGPDPASSPLERIVARETAIRAMSSLSPREEMVVRLRFGGEYRIPEIARTMRCSESTAKTHLRRALDKMARTLEAGNP